MDKEYLLELISRINTEEKNIRVSSETVSWKALREAETLTDPALFPVLREIILENEGKTKAKRETRSTAYFILGRLMEQSFDGETCAFFLRRLEAETDKYLLHSMLGRVQDWQGKRNILLPPELDSSPVVKLAEDDRWLVRHAAIHALGACPGEGSRAVLRFWLAQEDEKQYKYEMWYAAIAMQSVGEPEDIPLLERFLKSRRQDLKLTAKCAIQRIKEREAAAPPPKEVSP